MIDQMFTNKIFESARIISPQQMHRCGHGVYGTAVQSAFAHRTRLLGYYATGTPHNLVYDRSKIYKQHIKKCPHNSASADAEVWSHTTVQSAFAHHTSLHRYYAYALQICLTTYFTYMKCVSILHTDIARIISPQQMHRCGHGVYGTAVQSASAHPTRLLRYYATAMLYNSLYDR
jgi:hypothetical protein